MESTDTVLIMELDSDHQSEVLDQLQLLDILAIIKTMYFLKIGTIYWPVGMILIGRSYRSSFSTRPTQNSYTMVNSSVVISDKYTKMMFVNDKYFCAGNFSFNLTHEETIYESCYESIDSTGLYNSVVSEDDDDFVFEDGACCEDKTSLGPVCCILQLNEAVALK